jgi:hypothetical protein
MPLSPQREGDQGGQSVLVKRKRRPACALTINQISDRGGAGLGAFLVAFGVLNQV